MFLASLLSGLVTRACRAKYRVPGNETKRENQQFLIFQVRALSRSVPPVGMPLRLVGIFEL